MKLKVQAQYLKLGDVVGSGETVAGVIVNSVRWPSSKVCVILEKKLMTVDDIKRRYEAGDSPRITYWGKYTQINIERPEKVESNGS